MAHTVVTRGHYEDALKADAAEDAPKKAAPKEKAVVTKPLKMSGAIVGPTPKAVKAAPAKGTNPFLKGK